MGPRARRRLAWLAGVAIGLAVLAGVVRHFTHSSRPLVTKNEKVSLGTPENLGVPFGTSAAQLVRRLGQPSEKKSGCWIYDVKNGAEEIGDGFGQWIDKVKYCFAEGATGGQAVAHVSSHMVAHKVGKKHYAAGWSYIVIVGRGRAANSSG